MQVSADRVSERGKARVLMKMWRREQVFRWLCWLFGHVLLSCPGIWQCSHSLGRFGGGLLCEWCTSPASTRPWNWWHVESLSRKKVVSARTSTLSAKSVGSWAARRHPANLAPFLEYHTSSSLSWEWRIQPEMMEFINSCYLHFAGIGPVERWD